MDHQARLIALLSNTFDTHALRAFLRQHVGQRFVDDLPSPDKPKSHYIDLAAEQLIGRRALTSAFIAAWAERDPGHADDIRALAEPDSSHTPGAPAWSSSAPGTNALAAQPMSATAPISSPVTHTHFHAPVNHLAMHSGTGDQIVTTNITQPNAKPATNAQAVHQLRTEMTAIRAALDEHHEIQLEAEDKRARMILDLGHIIDLLEARLPADGAFTRQAMKSATIDAIHELENLRAIEPKSLLRLAQSGVSQSLLASVIIEVIKSLV